MTTLGVFCFAAAFPLSFLVVAFDSLEVAVFGCEESAVLFSGISDSVDWWILFLGGFAKIFRKRQTC